MIYGFFCCGKSELHVAGCATLILTLSMLGLPSDLFSVSVVLGESSTRWHPNPLLLSFPLVPSLQLDIEVFEMLDPDVLRIGCRIHCLRGGSMNV